MGREVGRISEELKEGEEYDQRILDENNISKIIKIIISLGDKYTFKENVSLAAHVW